MVMGNENGGLHGIIRWKIGRDSLNEFYYICNIKYY